MKIGAFSNRFNVTKDTVRFYISSGLLLPESSGSQYDFTDRDCQDMEIILHMKDLRFSLQEIRQFLAICRISSMVEPESVRDAIQLYQEKKVQIGQKIKELQTIYGKLDDDIQTLDNRHESTATRTGVPLRALSLLACPHCGRPLSLENASLDSRYIYSGKLHCDCGYEIQIKNGIILTGNVYTHPYDHPDLQRGLYRNVGDDFITYLQRCSDFALKQLTERGLKNKVILEGHCNGYFFLYPNIKDLDPGSTYIILDKYPEMLEMYKKNIEHMGLSLDILYIADAMTDYPLRPECVDIFLNFMGDNSHTLYYEHSYLGDIKKYLTSGACIIDANLGYPSYAKSLVGLRKKYPEGDCSGYCRDEWDRICLENGYRRHSQVVGIMTKSYNKYSFECHRDGEELYFETFYAEPISK